MVSRGRTLAVCCLLAMLASVALCVDIKKEQSDRERHSARKGGVSLRSCRIISTLTLLLSDDIP
jgi:hypothetical protein